MTTKTSSKPPGGTTGKGKNQDENPEHRYHRAAKQAKAATKKTADTAAEQGETKKWASYRLSPEALRLMGELDRVLGLNKTQCLETGVRMLAAYHGLELHGSA